MIEREKLLIELESLSEEKFRVFNEKIVHTSKYRVIGVRCPTLRLSQRSIRRIIRRFSNCRMTVLKK